MLVIAAVSNEVALAPVALALLLFPVVISSSALSAADNGPHGQLRPLPRFLYPVVWFISVLAIIGICIIGEDYVSDFIITVYILLGIIIGVCTFVFLGIAMADGPVPTR